MKRNHTWTIAAALLGAACDDEATARFARRRAGFEREASGGSCCGGASLHKNALGVCTSGVARANVDVTSAKSTARSGDNLYAAGRGLALVRAQTDAAAGRAPSTGAADEADATAVAGGAEPAANDHHATGGGSSCSRRQRNRTTIGGNALPGAKSQPAAISTFR